MEITYKLNSESEEDIEHILLLSHALDYKIALIEVVTKLREYVKYHDDINENDTELASELLDILSECDIPNVLD